MALFQSYQIFCKILKELMCPRLKSLSDAWHILHDFSIWILAKLFDQSCIGGSNWQYAHYHLNRNKFVMGYIGIWRKYLIRLTTTYLCGNYIIMAFENNSMVVQQSSLNSRQYTSTGFRKVLSQDPCYFYPMLTICLLL